MASFTKSSSKVSTDRGSSIKSPSRTPEENLSNLGGMPPTKDIKEINSANDPAKRGQAPDVTRGT